MEVSLLMLYFAASALLLLDIHMGNVLFRLPELEVSSPERIIEDLGPPQVGKVMRRDGAPLEPGVPEYLVEPAEYSAKSHHHFREVQLIDFGECTFRNVYLTS
jgi:hypothetical protein